MSALELPLVYKGQQDRFQERKFVHTYNGSYFNCPIMPKQPRRLFGTDQVFIMLTPEYISTVHNGPSYHSYETDGFRIWDKGMLQRATVPVGVITDVFFNDLFVDTLTEDGTFSFSSKQYGSDLPCEYLPYVEMKLLIFTREPVEDHKIRLNFTTPTALPSLEDNIMMTRDEQIVGRIRGGVYEILSSKSNIEKINPLPDLYYIVDKNDTKLSSQEIMAKYKSLN